MIVNRAGWKNLGLVKEPGRYMFRFGWRTIMRMTYSFCRDFQRPLSRYAICAARRLNSKKPAGVERYRAVGDDVPRRTQHWHPHPPHALDGEGTLITFDLQQQAGAILAGTAKFSGDNGICTGSVSDTKVFIDLQWNGGPRGQYHGDLGLDGNLSGITFDLTHPGTQAIWHSQGVKFNLGMLQG